MRLLVLPDQYAIVRLPAGAAAPAAPGGGALWSVTQTAEEVSVVAAEASLGSWSDAGRAEGGWRALAVEGPLDFSAVGVLARLAAPLAAARIPIFVLSTYDTDHLLVKGESLPAAIRALQRAGHRVQDGRGAGSGAASPEADPGGPGPTGPTGGEELAVHDEIPAGLAATLAAGLDADAAAAGVEPRGARLLGVEARDGDGDPVGGLLGETAHGWLRIRLLWVASERRGRGLGSRILTAAEEEAVRRGCHGAWVDTASYQAPEFYHHRGYRRLGVLEDYPADHRRLFFHKRLATRGPW